MSSTLCTTEKVTKADQHKMRKQIKLYRSFENLNMGGNHMKQHNYPGNLQSLV